MYSFTILIFYLHNVVGEKSFDCCLDYFICGDIREMELRVFGYNIFLSQNVSEVSDG